LTLKGIKTLVALGRNEATRPWAMSNTHESITRAAYFNITILNVFFEADLIVEYSNGLVILYGPSLWSSHLI